MKKNIAIIHLIVTNLFTLVYAMAQATIAKKNEYKAVTEMAMIYADSIKNEQARSIYCEEEVFKTLAELRNAHAELKLAEEKLAKCK